MRVLSITSDLVLLQMMQEHKNGVRSAFKDLALEYNVIKLQHHAFMMLLDDCVTRDMVREDVHDGYIMDITHVLPMCMVSNAYCVAKLHDGRVLVVREDGTVARLS